LVSVLRNENPHDIDLRYAVCQFGRSGFR
jgi:hypothetical protein